jgi:hypothetical protein
LFGSIERTRAAHKLDFIPGSVEWADFDPTATANAIAFLDVAEGLDRSAVEHTFERYMYDWRRKRSGTLEWANYSPYEIRIIGALVRLGRREEALELLRFFLSDRRPPEWNQWPEIAWKDRRAPAHVGDLPHTWVAAEYVLAVRSLFAYERAADRTLVVAAGLAREWTTGTGRSGAGNAHALRPVELLRANHRRAYLAIRHRTRCRGAYRAAAAARGALAGRERQRPRPSGFRRAVRRHREAPAEIVCQTSGSP